MDIIDNNNIIVIPSKNFINYKFIINLIHKIILEGINIKLVFFGEKQDDINEDWIFFTDNNNIFQYAKLILNMSKIFFIKDFLKYNKSIITCKLDYINELIEDKPIFIYNAKTELYNMLKSFFMFTDWCFYVNYYDDLFSNIKYKKNETNCLIHWMTNGRIQNRICRNKKISNDTICLNNIKTNPKIIAIIPVYGRASLLKYTIRRLYNKNKLFKVICVGNEKLEKSICLQENGIWVEHANKPLGKKWNYGFTCAKKYNPDAILFVGSSDWISSDWIEKAYPYCQEYGIVEFNSKEEEEKRVND